MADGVGAHAVIVPKDRAVGLNATAAKVASGAAETVPYITVTNLARTMRELKERDILLIGTSDDAERSKPFPDIFQAALARLPGVAAAEAVVVGDTPYDAQAAAGAGLRTIGVPCGGFPAAELREAGCIALYRDPQDLLQQYDQSLLAAGRQPG